jgi:hypothetical protein
MLHLSKRVPSLRCLASALLLAHAATATPALAGQFMFMPSVSVAKESRPGGEPSLENHQYIGDLYYSGDSGRFRFLSELQIDQGGWDMERLQVGWRLAPEVSLWFGRYHNPIGYWNMEHHHGHYMETSAERPRIIEFEDEGGPLPIHLTGFLLQGAHAMGDASLQYDFGVASGPKIDDELEPVDIVRDPKLNKLALVARFAFRPDATQDDQYGGFVAHTRIPVTGLTFRETNQTIAGFYLNRTFDRLRLFGEAFRVNNQVAQGSSASWPSYWAAYVQAEYKLAPAAWTAYARHEAISSNLNGDYLTVYPKLLKQRQLAGIRWDFNQNQALKLEVIHDTRFGGIGSNGLQIQWSGMFP